MKHLLIFLFLFSVNSNLKNEDVYRTLNDVYQTIEELKSALEKNEGLKNLTPTTKVWILNRWKENNKKEIDKYLPEKTESNKFKSNENKKTTYTEGNFSNDIIDMIAVGFLAGLIWVGLNFIRLLFMDFLYKKKLTLEKEKEYLSKRKNGYLTAFILGLGVYLISNSGAIIYKYFQSYNFVYIVNILISLQIMWMLYKHYSFNSNLKKQVNNSTTNDNSDVICK
ncbi:MAG: hypothetical protein CBE11_03835 [Rickettsiales bacterium TMED251]|nr:MAG: hypothetical protein CBE11_03835 [Rickettsiales bacterium TMED251]|tara:strand:- start:812 stop:1483 length:672 start_codon:yes stop_codon:yes gene_type:complete